MRVGAHVLAQWVLPQFWLVTISSHFWGITQDSIVNIRHCFACSFFLFFRFLPFIAVSPASILTCYYFKSSLRNDSRLDSEYTPFLRLLFSPFLSFGADSEVVWSMHHDLLAIYWGDGYWCIYWRFTGDLLAIYRVLDHTNLVIWTFKHDIVQPMLWFNKISTQPCLSKLMSSMRSRCNFGSILINPSAKFITFLLSYTKSDLIFELSRRKYI